MGPVFCDPFDFYSGSTTSLSDEDPLSTKQSCLRSVALSSHSKSLREGTGGKQIHAFYQRMFVKQGSQKQICEVTLPKLQVPTDASGYRLLFLQDRPLCKVFVGGPEASRGCPMCVKHTSRRRPLNLNPACRA